MSNLFERKKIDGSAIRNIKELITNQFKLSENTTLAVAELRCHEPSLLLQIKQNNQIRVS